MRNVEGSRVPAVTTQTPERPPGTIARLYSRAQATREPLERTLIGRMGDPKDIAAVAQFLISDAAGYMTGEIVHVNGGDSFG